ncbi:microfibril-associated glycoprotein 4-like isoform X1 [Mytilus edulis]|uniref:microfibril-associated glycoprotein 4-like isoform X1 n=1 Tax=Mytilus edulis TaxID=6550 RepID=UPI0039EF43C3
MFKWSVCVLLISFIALVIECNQECWSCSGVESSSECNHRIQCDDGEVCYMHNFVTESGAVEFDYGCGSSLACSNSGSSILGRRSEGHHVKCTLCCDTRLCNDKLNCTNSGQLPSRLPRECTDLQLSVSGVHTIYPYGQMQLPASVYCYVDSSFHTWTVIQRRINGSVNFYRDWQAYKTGFGQANDEYWLGNDNIHELTSDGNHELMVVMTDFSGVTKFAEYLSFHISSEANGYRLLVSKYDGTAGDSLSRQNGHQFTTFDRDNDGDKSNCAVLYQGAWWYDNCHKSNLNGVYYHGHHDEYATGIDWYTFHGYHYSMKTTMMMIRKY